MEWFARIRATTAKVTFDGWSSEQGTRIPRRDHRSCDASLWDNCYTSKMRDMPCSTNESLRNIDFKHLTYVDTALPTPGTVGKTTDVVHIRSALPPSPLHSTLEASPLQPAVEFLLPTDTGSCSSLLGTHAIDRMAD